MTYKGKTITKHIRGNWFVRVRYNGKAISIYGRTQFDCYEKLKAFADKTENDRAAKWLQRMEALTQPIIESKSAKAYTFREWFDEWLQSYKIGNVRASTIDGFKNTFKYLKKLYDTEIGEITNLMLSKAINEVTACRTKDGLHNMIKQLFAAAFNNRLIESNPAANLPRPKQIVVNQKRVFTPEQENKFIGLCLANLEQYEPFLICVLQGVRKGEMLALRPNDFDFERNTLRIDESYDCNYTDDLLTKNAASNRTMPMFELTKRVLSKYKDRNPNERIYANFNTKTLGYRLKKLLRQGDLPPMTIHELRHTFITRCHEKGIDEIVVQKWVGHAIGSAMTKAVYTHIGSEAEQRYIELLNQKTA